MLAIRTIILRRFVKAKSSHIAERLFWVVVSLLGFSFAGVLLRNSVLEWMNQPGGNDFDVSVAICVRHLLFSAVSISSFAYPATKLPYPAITICKTRKYDVGEYIRWLRRTIIGSFIRQNIFLRRAVYDNFEFDCRQSADAKRCVKHDTKRLRSHFKEYVELKLVDPFSVRGNVSISRLTPVRLELILSAAGTRRQRVLRGQVR